MRLKLRARSQVNRSSWGGGGGARRGRFHARTGIHKGGERVGVPVGDLPRRRAASAWLVLAILFLVGSASVNPEPLEGVGKLALHTDKCSYPVGEAVQITFMKVGDGGILYLQFGGRCNIPFC